MKLFVHNFAEVSYIKGECVLVVTYCKLYIPGHFFGPKVKLN